MKHLLFFSAGVIFWTLMEYLLHRFLGHEWLFKNKFRKEHQKHHHLVGYFASIKDKAITSIIVGSIVYLATFSLSFTGGFILMYLYYEYIHKSLHVTAPKNTREIKLRKHHMHHHFCDSMSNHGVTSRFWDKVFRTYQAPTIVTINKKFKMDWLCDENSVKPIYQKDYQLVEKTICT